VVARVIDGEAIIINLASGLYYATRGAGAVVWEGVEAGLPVGEIVSAVCRQFAVAPEMAETDVHRLIDDLVEEQLIAPNAAANGMSSPMSQPESAGLTYVAPNLVKYTDMAQFLALDPPLPNLEP